MSPKTWAKSLFTPGTSRPNRTRLGLERFDDRLVPAATATVVGSTLDINTGDAGATVRAMDFGGSYITVQATTGDGARLNTSVLKSGLTGIVYHGGNGADSFENATALPATAYTGAGDDVLKGNPYSTAPDTFYGGYGNDIITGGAGNDQLYGEWGDDVLTGGEGRDVMNGGDGFDQANSDAADPTPISIEGFAGRGGGLTTSFQGGELRIVGDDGPNAARVRSAAGGAIEVVDDRPASTGGGRVVARVSAGVATRLVFEGNGGPDSFYNDTGLPSRAAGGSGNDILCGGTGADELDGGDGADSLYGGAGNDTFRGSPGSDVYYGGAGADVLDRRGYHGFFTDGNAADTTYDSVSGKTGGRLSAAELTAGGQLNTRLVGDRLYLTGPSGAGFALRSNWTIHQTDWNVWFNTNSSVTIEAAWGYVNLPLAGWKFTVGSTRTPVDGVGNGADFWVNEIPVTSDALSSALKLGTFAGLKDSVSGTLHDATGANLSLPGVGWGVALGGGVGDAAAPLNAAVPYLYAHLQSGYTLSSARISVSTPGSYSATVAVAPGDGTIYAGLTGAPTVSDIGVGVSTQGYLPFHPRKVPDGTQDPSIFGHLYLRGEVELPDLPVAVNGEVVVDLDANDDGKLLNNRTDVTAQAVGQALDGLGETLKTPTAVLGRGVAALQDVSVGLNAGVKLSYQGLSLDLANATYYRTPTEIGYRGSSENPFEGIPVLESVVPTGGYDASGFLRTDGAWGLRLEGKAGSLPGFPQGRVTVTGGSGQVDESGAGYFAVDAVVKVANPFAGGAAMTVRGAVGFTGDYSLSCGFQVAGLGLMNMVYSRTDGQSDFSISGPDRNPASMATFLGNQLATWGADVGSTLIEYTHQVKHDLDIYAAQIAAAGQQGSNAVNQTVNTVTKWLNKTFGHLFS